MRQDVPGQVGPLESVRLEVSPGASDIWLLGQTAYQGFPRLWSVDGNGWEQRPAAGHPSQALSVAALGAGALAVALPDGAGLVRREYSGIDWPLAGTDLKVLSDGTLLASKNPPGAVFLGVGHGTDRRWVQVTLARS